MQKIIISCLMCLLLCGFWGFAYGAPEVVTLPDEWQVCSQDSDCIWFKTQCSSCLNGNDDFKPYNTKWYEGYLDLKASQCPAAAVLTDDVIRDKEESKECADFPPTGTPRCTDGVCDVEP